MAIVRAVKSGSWSDPTVWNTGALPTSADDVYSNNFTVAINVSANVLSVSNAPTTGVNFGGGFTVSSSNITLTANVFGNNFVNTPCITVNVAFPGVFTVNGNVNASTSNAASSGGISHSSSGIINVNGAVTGGFAWGIFNQLGGVINVVGNVTGGTANSQTGSGISAYGIFNNASGSVNITGNTVGGSAASTYGVFNNQAGTVTATGSATGGFGGSAHGIFNSGSGSISVTGNVTGGSNSSFGVVNNSSGSLNITGDVTGGSGAGGASNNSTGTMIHVGAAYASTAAVAIGVGGVGQVTILTGPLISTGGTGVLAANSGVNPCSAARWFPADTALSTFTYTMRGATATGSPSERPARVFALPEGYNAGYPATGNVRSGTTFGPGSIYTGTCAVPAAGSVALGVPVDNTTGTATLTAANIRSALGMASANLDTQIDALPTAAEIRSELSSASAITLDQPTSSLTTPGSIGERLKIASTVQTTAQQLSDALSD